MAAAPDTDWLARRRRLESLLRLQAAVMSGDPAHHEAIRMLADALADPEEEIRQLSASALTEFGAEAQIALPELIQATSDESVTVRRRAIRAIGYIGPVAADDAMPAVIAATEDPDQSVALQAVATMGEFGPLAADGVPAMLAALWTGDVRQRAVAGVSLQRVGAAAIPALVQTLVHPSADVRAKVANVLGKMGPSAAEARTAVESLLSDPDESVRSAASEALAQIGNGSS
jgi:HEAT repeat protein